MHHVVHTVVASSVIECLEPPPPHTHSHHTHTHTHTHSHTHTHTTHTHTMKSDLRVSTLSRVRARRLRFKYSSLSVYRFHCSSPGGLTLTAGGRSNSLLGGEGCQSMISLITFQITISIL